MRLLAQRCDLRALSRALSVSVLNQIVSSGTNFILSLYLVRALSPADFGLYNIGFATSLFVAALGNALLLTQMVVNAPGKPPELRRAYVGRMLLSVLGFCIVFISSVSIVFFVFDIWSVPIARHADYGIAISAASSAYLIKEFFVRDAYSENREVSALGIHTALAATLATMLTVLHVAGATVTVEVALGAYAVSHLIAAFLGYWMSKLGGRVSKMGDVSAKARLIETDFREAWNGGKWSIAATILYFLRSQSHIIAVAATSGPGGVAVLHAARLFVTPAALLTPALSQVFLPRAARMRATALHADMVRAGRLLSMGLLALALTYSIGVLLIFEPLSSILLGGSYSHSLFWLVAAWALYVSVQSVRNGQEIILQALKRFRHQAIVSLLSALITLAAVGLLVWQYSEIGAVLGMVFGEVAMVAMIAARLRMGER